jgi:hypothetical protein
VKEKRTNVSKSPDIDLTATVKARELCFDEVPDTEVRFWGHPERNSVSGTERENLPEKVQRGVTYRNASVRLRIASELIDDRLDLWKDRKEEQG